MPQQFAMHKSFERLGERLLTAGIAPRHVRRYLAELDEHLDDLKAEERRAGHDRADAEARAMSRLGAPEDLARAMTGRPEFRSWTARAPWAALVVAPPVVLALILALTAVAIVVIVQTHRPTPDLAPDLPGWFASLTATIIRIERLALPVLLGWGVVAIAIRQRIRLVWPALGLAVIAMLGATTELFIFLPRAPGQHGEVSVGMHLDGLVAAHIVVNLILASAPYLIWRRWRSTLSRTA